MNDNVNHPKHYTDHPSGIECIQITEHMNFCLGNAVKYIWRADLKNDAIEDLQKAQWYLNQEINRRIKREKKCNETKEKVTYVNFPENMPLPEIPEGFDQAIYIGKKWRSPLRVFYSVFDEQEKKWAPYSFSEPSGSDLHYCQFSK
jgi:hypothetical protein